MEACLHDGSSDPTNRNRIQGRRAGAIEHEIETPNTRSDCGAVNPAGAEPRTHNLPWEICLAAHAGRHAGNSARTTRQRSAEAVVAAATPTPRVATLAPCASSNANAPARSPSSFNNWECRMACLDRSAQRQGLVANEWQPPGDGGHESGVVRIAGTRQPGSALWAVEPLEETAGYASTSGVWEDGGRKAPSYPISKSSE